MCNVYKFEVGKKYVNRHDRVICCVAKSGFQDGNFILEMETGGCYTERECNAHLYTEYVKPVICEAWGFFELEPSGRKILYHAKTREQAIEMKNQSGCRCSEVFYIASTIK